MKKLFIVFSIDYQLISHRKAVVQAAIDAGYNVTVVAKDTGYRDVIESMDARFIDLPINRVGTNILEEIKTFRFLKNLYSQEKPDIVHHVSIKVVLWGGLAAKTAKVKNVVNAINGLGVFFANGKVDTLSKRVFMKIIKFSHNRGNVATIFQNNDDKTFFTDYGAIKPEQVRMIHGSGVDLDEFQYTPEPEYQPISIVFTSRMVKEKGVVELIEAAKQIEPEFKDKATFKLYGLIETNPQAVSKEYLDNMCDGTYIQYMGHTDNVKKVLQDSAIVVLPSYYREGLPKSLIEACAIGRPIITTDWVGCRETVTNGKNGFIIPIQNADKLAECLKILINDKNKRTEMGLASRQLAETVFSIKTVVNEHLKIYDSF